MTCPFQTKYVSISHYKEERLFAFGTGVIHVYYVFMKQYNAILAVRRLALISCFGNYV